MTPRFFSCSEMTWRSMSWSPAKIRRAATSSSPRDCSRIASRSLSDNAPPNLNGLRSRRSTLEKRQSWSFRVGDGRDSNCFQASCCCSRNHSGNSRDSTGPERVFPVCLISSCATNDISVLNKNGGHRPPVQFGILAKDLSDRAFHLQLDQALELDAVFHGELADEIVDKAVDAQAHGLRFGQAALLHVKDLFGADLADAGFVLHGVAGAAHSNRRIGICP